MPRCCIKGYLGQMSRLGKQDANLSHLLNLPKTPCEGKSCYFCTHHKWDSGNESVGMAPYVYCGLAEGDGFDGYEALQGYVEVSQPRGKHFEFEKVMAENCPHFEPIMLTGRCPISGKDLPNIPRHLHEYWGMSGYEPYAVAGPDEVGPLSIPIRRHHRDRAIEKVEVLWVGIRVLPEDIFEWTEDNVQVTKTYTPEVEVQVTPDEVLDGCNSEMYLITGAIELPNGKLIGG